MADTSLEAVVSPEAVAWLRAFRRDVVAAFPGAVDEVVLFGSRARGDARPDSDYDVAVVVRDGTAREPDLSRRLSSVTFDYKVKGHLLQAVPFEASEFEPPRSEIALRIAAEGVPVT